MAALDRGYDEFLSVRIRDAVDPAVLVPALHRALSSQSLRDYFAPIARDLSDRVIASLRSSHRELGAVVPEESRRAIDALLERPDLVPEALVRKVFEQQLVVDAIDDTLYDGLLQFNTTVNPFFADWGLPSILKRMPIGGGLILSSMEALRSDFEKRLEPEIRKFVSVFSRRATTEMTEAVISRAGDPKFVELRRNVVAFLYTQSLAELLAGVGAEAERHGVEAAEHLVVALAERDRAERGLEKALERFVDEQGKGTIGEFLERTGAVGRPDTVAWAELLWPLVETVASSEAVRELVERVTGEFYDSLAEPD